MTTMKVSEETKKRLMKYGSFGQTFDDVINSVLDKVEKKKKGSE